MVSQVCRSQWKGKKQTLCGIHDSIVVRALFPSSWENLPSGFSECEKTAATTIHAAWDIDKTFWLSNRKEKWAVSGTMENPPTCRSGHTCNEHLLKGILRQGAFPLRKLSCRGHTLNMKIWQPVKTDTNMQTWHVPSPGGNPFRGNKKTMIHAAACILSRLDGKHPLTMHLQPGNRGRPQTECPWNATKDIRWKLRKHCNLWTNGPDRN